MRGILWVEAGVIRLGDQAGGAGFGELSESGFGGAQLGGGVAEGGDDHGEIILRESHGVEPTAALAEHVGGEVGLVLLEEVDGVDPEFGDGAGAALPLHGTGGEELGKLHGPGVEQVELDEFAAVPGELLEGSGEGATNLIQRGLFGENAEFIDLFDGLGQILQLRISRGGVG